MARTKNHILLLPSKLLAKKKKIRENHSVASEEWRQRNSVKLMEGPGVLVLLLCCRQHCRNLYLVCKKKYVKTIQLAQENGGEILSNRCERMLKYCKKLWENSSIDFGRMAAKYLESLFVLKWRRIGRMTAKIWSLILF